MLHGGCHTPAPWFQLDFATWFHFQCHLCCGMAKELFAHGRSGAESVVSPNGAVSAWNAWSAWSAWSGKVRSPRDSLNSHSALLRDALRVYRVYRLRSAQHSNAPLRGGRPSSNPSYWCPWLSRSVSLSAPRFPTELTVWGWMRMF